MLSLEECKKILNQDGILYTDEEVILIRDWMYHIADIAIDALQRENEDIIDS